MAQRIAHRVGDATAGDAGETLRIAGRDDPQEEVWAVVRTADPDARRVATVVCRAVAEAVEGGVRAGELDRPRRSIRLVLDLEPSGYQVWLERSDLFQPPLAGIGLGLVGVRPGQCGHLLSVQGTTGPSAVFVNDLCALVAKGVLAGDNPGYRVRAEPCRFEDAVFWGDPKGGFPCPWLETRTAIREPVPDMVSLSALVSGRALRACATVVGAYLLYLADAGTAELLDVARSHTADVIRTLEGQRGSQSGAWAELRVVQHHLSLQRLQRWAWGGDHAGILRELAAMEAAVRRAAHARKPIAKVGLVAFRTGRVGRRQSPGLDPRPLFWVNGERTVDQIASLQTADAASTVAEVEQGLQAWEGAGSVQFVSPTELVSAARLKQDLRTLGVRVGMDLMVHSSLSSIGLVRGGAETVVDALLSAVGTRGTLLMPSFNHGHAAIYNPLTTRTTNGAIADAFWRRPRAVRSLNGTHPVAALGPRARGYCEGHVEAGIWTADSPIGRLVQRGGWILCLGVGLDRATAYHVAEVSVPCRCLDMFAGRDRRVQRDGSVVASPGLLWRGGTCPVPPQRLERGLARLGQLSRGRIGRAPSLLCAAVDLWSLRRRHLAPVCPTCPVRPDPGWKRVR
ncbi:MAG TPA: AAC(3) family N-acetyltransferase [Spirochaetia bacterium]|nr:AAC(3) family N-acetyltransferase [Spirochaetia bacterium]